MNPILNTETGRITKRLVVTLIGSGLIYLFLHEHRNWVWAYFETVMTLDSPAPDVTQAAQVVATASITALTTAFNVSATTIGAIVLFFVTGNVAAIMSMFKFSSIANTSAAMSATAESVVTQETRKDIIADETAKNENLRERQE